MSEITFSVPGMYADHHVTRVVEVLKDQPGVSGVVASALRKRITVTYEATQTSTEKLQGALEAAGYPAEKVEGAIHEEDLAIRRSN